MSLESIELGRTVIANITGFVGCTIAKTEWVNGCVRWGVQSAVLDKDGLPTAPQWFDQGDIRLLSFDERQKAGRDQEGKSPSAKALKTEDRPGGQRPQETG